jgi:hypothetical protein
MKRQRSRKVKKNGPDASHGANQGSNPCGDAKKIPLKLASYSEIPDVCRAFLHASHLTFELAQARSVPSRLGTNSEHAKTRRRRVAA